jgi:hypothetical protein
LYLNIVHDILLSELIHTLLDSLRGAFVKVLREVEKRGGKKTK